MKTVFSRHLAVTAVLGWLAHSPLQGATNAWTSLVTGNWHDLSWSLNSLPAAAYEAIAITNHESKAVIIGATTAENYPASLQIQNLVIASPPGWTNTLLLNYLAHRDPLTVSDSITVASGGVLMNLFSKLHLPGSSGSLTLDGGSFVQEGGSTILSNRLLVGWARPGTLELTNGALSARSIVIGMTNSGHFTHSGGTVTSDVVELGYSSAAYQLESGLLQARYLAIGDRLPPYISGSGIFSHRGGTSILDEVRIGLSGGYGTYHLSGGNAQISSITVGQSGSAEFRISGGRANVGGITVSVNERASGTVILEGGELETDRATIGYTGWGYFRQYAGVHRISSLTVSGDSYRWVGFYDLTNGMLHAGEIALTTGVMYQSGGTNYITNGLSLGGRGSGFSLSGGLMISAGCGISGGTGDERSVFNQTGGTHQINGTLGVGGRYTLSGGTLAAQSISLYGEGELTISGGHVVSNSAVNLSGGTLLANLPELNLGTLQLNQSAGLLSSRPRLSFNTNATVIRFRDSQHLPWHPETTLWISGWNGHLTGGGSHKIYIGLGAALSSHQLSRIRFENPPGLPAGNYFAQQLPTGEIVPSQNWYIQFTRQSDGLNFRWDSPWILEFSTSPQGPYQPVQGDFTYTKLYSGNSGFFRLTKNP